MICWISHNWCLRPQANKTHRFHLLTIYKIQPGNAKLKNNSRGAHVLACNMFAKKKKLLLSTPEEACKHMFYNCLKIVEAQSYSSLVRKFSFCIPSFCPKHHKSSEITRFMVSRKQTKNNPQRNSAEIDESHELTMPACAIITSQGHKTIHG